MNLTEEFNQLIAHLTDDVLPYIYTTDAGDNYINTNNWFEISNADCETFPAFGYKKYKNGTQINLLFSEFSNTPAMDSFTCLTLQEVKVVLSTFYRRFDNDDVQAFIKALNDFKPVYIFDDDDAETFNPVYIKFP